MLFCAIQDEFTSFLYTRIVVGAIVSLTGFFCCLGDYLEQQIEKQKKQRDNEKV